MATVVLTVKAGADLAYDFVCRDPRPGETTVLTDAELDIRSSVGAVTALAEFDAPSSELFVDGEVAYLRVPAAVTSTWTTTEDSLYVFALEVVTSGGTRYRPFEGTVIVTPEGAR